MKNKIFLIILFGIWFSNSFGQSITILPDGITPSFTKIYPQKSYQSILNINNPAEGDMVYDSTFNILRVRRNQKWVNVGNYLNDFSPSIAINGNFGEGAITELSDMKIDQNGNHYYAGGFQSTMNINGVELNATDSTDIFIVKFAASGQLLWLKKCGGSGFDKAYDMEIDNSGNIYLAGTIGGNANFGTINISSTGVSDLFITKINPNGDFQWVTQGVGNEIPRQIEIDNSGSIWLGGSFTTNFQMGSFQFTCPSGISNVFLAKINSSGNVINAYQFGGNVSTFCESIAIDSDGAIILGGRSSTGATFGSLTANFSPANTGLYLLKVNNNGSVNWLQVVQKKISGINIDIIKDIKIHPNGNIYLAGNCQGEFTMGAFSFNTTYTFNQFLMGLNSNGTVQWVKIYETATLPTQPKILIMDDNIYYATPHDQLIEYGGIESQVSLNNFVIEKMNLNGQSQTITEFYLDKRNTRLFLEKYNNGSFLISGQGNSLFKTYNVFKNLNNQSILSLLVEHQ